MAGSFLLPLYVMVYQGVKESWKFQYIVPKLAKKVKGNSGWMEVRFRHPSPANVPVNEQFAAREHARHHFKTPYPFSRYHVRHFWDHAKEYGVHSIVNVLPELSTLSPQQEAKFLGYIKGDDTGNGAKREKYLAAYKELSGKNNPEEWSEERRKEIAQDARQIFDPIMASVNERIQLDDWEDAGKPPNESPYYFGPNTDLHDYGLVHMSSYEMHLYYELERYIEQFRDVMDDEAVPTVEGNAGNWQILDGSHRPDQQKEVARNLKQRNIKTIS